MEAKSVLVVDDEKNIRLTVMQALENEDWRVDGAVNGEEALQRLESEDFDLMLLDLKMPGMDGMEVLRHVAEDRPDVRVAIITAHGTVESAVEAMKLGAIDYLQKPFAPDDVRGLVARVLSRDLLEEEQNMDYESRLELAMKCINNRHFDAAEEHVRKAIDTDPKRPEAYNLLGALLEMRDKRQDAQKQYRVALEMDPTYDPARENLQRTTLWTLQPERDGIALGKTGAQGEAKAAGDETPSDAGEAPPEENE